eukprot:PhF_6_TR27351/c7_g5_i5/m.40208
MLRRNTSSKQNTETRLQFQTLVGKIRRLEPLETITLVEGYDKYLLLLAARYGHDVCIRTLLSIDPSMTKMVCSDGRSALHWAAEHGHDDCIRTLLNVDPSMTKLVGKDGSCAL